MQNLIVKNSISKNLLKNTASLTLINSLNKCSYHRYYLQNNKSFKILNKNSLNTSVLTVPLTNSLINYFNNSSSYKLYSTESNKSTEENKNKIEEDKKDVEEEEEEEEDDEIKNINDMKIKITDAAAERLNEINDNSKQYLRIVVEAGGCHGFQYLLDLTENIDPDDDIIFEKNGAKVVVDTMSLPYIDGATLNFKDDLMGSSFEIIDNPNATESCGCGNSFSA
ncbi:hypothetical protein H8356DRAFT_1722745 [Neocallimastix lanati (nom. inval.)]|jgi:iron-sulfur cluster assembly accessory protein|nr:hypothetical protein H8356DRAFT_1722745 [Neocallimastix sp. JGI-2020a]